MNIRTWPLDKIMQLPDCVFGRRFGVFVAIQRKEIGTSWDISELALPETCVLWEVEITALPFVAAASQIRLALGDQLPTTTAMMDQQEPLLHGAGLQGPEPRIMLVGGAKVAIVLNIRQPIAAAGRRLILEMNFDTGQASYVQVGIVVSSIPTEVPEWLISGQHRSRW